LQFFKFYRYGFRHPALADKRTHRALILDFGGGTFDTCVVETKKDGDIRHNGRNSDPLGASSVPIGGFEINRQIAEHLASLVHKGNESKLKKGLEIYKKWRRAPEDLSSYSIEYSSFVQNFDRLVHDIEQAKIALSRNIPVWNLENVPRISVPVRVPRDLFSDQSSSQTLQLHAADLLRIFGERIWPRLKEKISSTLNSARAQMNGAPINVVLLSGGSSSFGWLKMLLKRDFDQEIGEANILTLPEYHDIVAKGLAIECARRFHIEKGDFGSVTYNRLCLTLDSDSKGQFLPRYSPKFGSEKATLPEGVLLPSATALGGLIDTPLRWKFRLEHPPKQQLEYYFLRSSFDPDDLANLQNVEGKILFTPKSDFDSQLQLELTVGKDGTAKPRFIYKTGRGGEDSIAVEGRPFYLDMTNVGCGESDNAYLGIDFGTSNSAISYLSRQHMDVIRARSADNEWLTLKELISSLPYPLARPLNRVMGGSTSMQSHEGFMRALEFLEATLALLAFTSYLELCTISRTKSRTFKGFTQRSIGPLWGLLRESLGTLGKKAVIMAPALRLLEPERVDDMNKIVNSLNQRKHNKTSGDEIDIVGAMTFIGNVANDVYKVSPFGFFEGVQRKRFGKGYMGRFRMAHGAIQPFSLCVEYEGTEAFSDFQPFILDLQRSEALCMEPLALWEECPVHQSTDEQHFYLFDGDRGSSLDFKAMGYDCSLAVSEDGKYGALVDALRSWRQQDPQLAKSVVDKITVPDDMES
jgi:hypothetical protein